MDPVPEDPVGVGETYLLCGVVENMFLFTIMTAILDLAATLKLAAILDLCSHLGFDGHLRFGGHLELGGYLVFWMSIRLDWRPFLDSGYPFAGFFPLFVNDRKLKTWISCHGHLRAKRSSILLYK